MTGAFKKLWAELDISNDHFIRTTDPEHVRVVQHVFQKLYDSGDIYQEGRGLVTARHARHSSSNLSLLRVTAQIAGAVSNGCRRRATSSVFRDAQDRLLAHIEANPDFLQPATRRHEMVNFIKNGLEDLCVSRTSFD